MNGLPDDGPGPRAAEPVTPARSLAEAGWSVRCLDLGDAEDKAAFMDRCADTLGLPDWFGRNWDALADSLTDTGVWPSSAREHTHGLVLVVTGWREFARRCPGEWGTAQEIFAQSVAERRDTAPTLTVVLGLG
ncbi:barstar family protein [Streptomyces beihaiensis]|uniref:Barstar family protein n=1 Tax=Streptomyces beihaiensis TaxID=2984495 RepID=A0ABT3U0Z7_9ACTN|nr:barstar family protein [Streptomyces beihaiensis]MCX3062964.1 barstar family protein [Streptomyces beihaiensis]